MYLLIGGQVKIIDKPDKMIGKTPITYLAFFKEKFMDLLNGKIKTIYLKYLFAAFGSALITSIYGVVDMIMVGQYHGPDGTAALAIVAPFWNIIYSLGLLVGIGGSILFSSIKGKENNNDNANKYFTLSLYMAITISIVTWILILFLEEPLLYAFGGTSKLIPLAKRYLIPVKFSVPVFIFTQFLSSFLRNDNDPLLATISVILGGIFNIIGDYVFVFTFNLGILGAGIATVGSASISVIIMCIHFFKKKNTLKIVKIDNIFSKIIKIISSGFSPFFVDVSMGILTILFNNQIMKYLNDDALAVYGIIINISTFIQCLSYGVGQASQPIISINYGANNYKRINKMLFYNIITCLIISAIWISGIMLVPNGFVKMFMAPTNQVLKIAPKIIRTYALSFIFLPINVYSTYYFQSILRPKTAMIISLLRGLVISGFLILFLPFAFNGNSIWLAMPITEFVVFIIVIIFIIMANKKIKVKL